MEKKAKYTSLSLMLSKNQFQDWIYECCPKLQRQPFELYTVTRRRQLQQVKVENPAQLRDLKYQGVLVVSAAHNIPPGVVVDNTIEHENVGLDPPSFVAPFPPHIMPPEVIQDEASIQSQPVIDASTENGIAMQLQSTENPMESLEDSETSQPLSVSNTITTLGNSVRSQPFTSQPLSSNDISLNFENLTAVSLPGAFFDWNSQIISHSTESTQTNFQEAEQETSQTGDCIELYVVLQNIRQSCMFQKTTKPQDVYGAVRTRFLLEDDFLLVEEGKSCHLPVNSNLTLAQWRVKSNTSYNVITDVDTYLGIQKAVEESEEEEMNDTDITFRQPVTPSKVDVARKAVLSLFTATQQILVRRREIVTDAINQFQGSDMLHCRLFVSFAGESGEDLDGLTGEFFTVFWQECGILAGMQYKYFAINPTRALSIEEVKAVGRIFIQGFILSNYIPVQITPAVIFYLITGRLPSAKFCLDSFINTLDTQDQKFLREL